MRRLRHVILFIIMFVVVAPTVMSAAPAELSVTAQSALEKVISGADSKVANNLRIQLNTLRTTQERDQVWDEKIKGIHYQNEVDLIDVRKRIKLIDDDKVSKLNSQVKQTKERYKPLFNTYAALNQQIGVARILKNKKLNSVLRSQADVMKIAVQLARKDIRNKEDSLKKAKDNKARTVKKHRATLSDIDPIKVKIKSERSRMVKTKQRFASKWKTLNAAIKKSDAKSILRALVSLVSIAQQVNDHMNNIHRYEKSINSIVLSVKSQIP